jgi:hypothetical protein
MASNGREALDKLKAQPFDLVLLDIMMPDINGYEVLEQVKATPALRDIPFIMISPSTSSRASSAASSSAPRTTSASRSIRRCCVRASVHRSKRSACATSFAGTWNGSNGNGFRARPAARHVAAAVPDLLALAPDRRSRRHGAGQRGRRGSVRLLLCREHRSASWSATVCGKGAAAAMFMARARSLVRISVNLWKEWRTDAMSIRGRCWKHGQSRALPGQRR